jgi:hypothetical protein
MVGEKDHSDMKSKLARRWRSQGNWRRNGDGERSDEVYDPIPF